MGFLTDRRIKLALDNNFLIVPNTWDDRSIRHASYTLRLGDRIEVASASKANLEERRDFVVQDLKEGDYFDLMPGDTAKLFSFEHLNLPDTVLAFTVSRGLMFFESLLPENTYADPGFAGQLYTTVTNLSNRVVRLHYKDPIARLFFYHLAEPVAEPFQRGAAKGLRQRLESFRATQIGTAEECRNATYPQLVDQLRHLSMGGTQIAELTERQKHRMIGLLVFSACWPPLLLLANLNPWVKGAFGFFLTNVSAIVCSALISLIIPRAWAFLRRI